MKTKYTFNLTRREFLHFGSLGVLGFIGLPAAIGEAEGLPKEFQRFQGRDVFARIVDKSAAQGWSTLPIGELMGRIALELKGTPVASHTLDVSNRGNWGHI